EIGIGFEAGRKNGSDVHDEIGWNETAGYYRKTNRLGGFEGGMTTGMPIVVKGVMKPIATLYKPLQSVDINTKEPFKASVERSDSCAVPAAAVVMEHVVAFELAKEITDRFTSDQCSQLKKAVDDYREEVRNFYMNTLTVQASTNNYEIVIEEGIRFSVSMYLKNDDSSVFIITDDTVASLYAGDVSHSLQKQG